jgi:hypothetical protein
VGTIGELGALVNGERIISIAKEQGRHALGLEIKAKAASDCKGDVFFGKLVGQGGTALIAPVARIDHCEVAYWKQR